MPSHNRFRQLGAIISCSVPGLMVILTICLIPYRIWFFVTGSTSWMQTNVLFVFVLPLVLSLWTTIAAILGLLMQRSFTQSLLDYSVMASQMSATLYCWPLLFGMQALGRSGRNARLMISDYTRSQLGMFQLFAPDVMYPPYRWTLAAITVVTAVLIITFVVLALRGKLKEAIVWPLITLVVGFFLALET